MAVNLSPHPTWRICFSISVALLFALAPLLTLAQQRGPARPSQAAQPAAKDQSGSKEQESKDSARARRAQALAVLDETAYAARLIDDLFYRARIQMLAADALWPFEEQSARALFRRAWDSATAADKADQEADEREASVPSDSQGAYVTDSRDEVLARVAARDPQLAGVFLQEYLRERDGEKNPEQNKPSRRTPWRELSAAGARRLALALELLGNNDPVHAAQIAAPVVVEGVSGDLMAFILHLREQSADQADALYLSLLKRSRMDAEMDANAVLLLSSPIVSPGLLVVVDERGSLQFRPIARLAPKKEALPPPSAAARKAFYDLAANVLLRPVAPRPDLTAAQAATTLYFAIGRLVAFFERDAAQYASELRARESALINELEAARRDQLSAQFELSSLTPERAGDPLKRQVEQLAHSADAVERDRIALGIIKTAARHRLWDRAKRTAAEITDAGQQRAALSFIAVSQIADIARAYADDKEDDFEDLAKFIGSADVPPFASAWGFAQTAVIAARKGDSRRVAELLDEAERYASRVQRGTRQQVAAYALVTVTASRLDKARAWRLLSEVVRAANAVEDYTGDEPTLDLAGDENAAEDAPENFSIETDAFRLDGIFATMSRLDFEKALTEARALQRKVPQAIARIAIARAALEKKQ